MRPSGLSWMIIVLLAAGAAADLVEPDLSGMAPSVREAIEQLRAHVEALAAREKTPAEELSVAYYALGEVYHAHGLTESAAAVYLESLRLNPDNERAAYYLGCIHQQNGQFEDAAARFHAVLSRRPDAPALLIRLGNVHLELGQVETAQGFFERALAQDASLAAAHYGLGRAAVAQGKTETAVTQFTQALELQPKASVVHYPLALAYRKLGDLGKARFHLERHAQVDVTFPDPGLERLSRIAATSALQVVLSLAADRESFSARDYLGFTLGQLGKTVGSIRYLREVIRTKQADPQPGQATELARIHYAVAGLLILKDSDEEAMTELSSAVELAPGFAAAHLMLANALARTGDFRAAVASYDRSLALDPDNGEAWIKRATARIRLGEEGEAVAELRQLTEQDPGAAAGWLRLAAVLERLGKTEEAVAAYEKAVALDLVDAEKAVAHRNLAALLRQQGELAEAVGHYETALSLADSVDARLDLAGTLGLLDRYGEAAAQYAAVVAVEPANEAARLGEISALTLSGHYREVFARLEDAYRTLPESPSPAHLLARFLAASPEEDLRDGQRALEISQALFGRRRSLAIGETVAMAMAQTGNSDGAVELQRSLLSAAEKGGAGERVTARLAVNLARYEQGLRCCADSGPAVLLPPPEPAER